MAFWAHNHKSHRYIYAVSINSTVRKAIPHSTAHSAKISDNIDLCAVLCATVWMGLIVERERESRINKPACDFCVTHTTA